MIYQGSRSVQRLSQKSRRNDALEKKLGAVKKKLSLSGRLRNRVARLEATLEARAREALRLQVRCVYSAHAFGFLCPMPYPPLPPPASLLPMPGREWEGPRLQEHYLEAGISAPTAGGACGEAFRRSRGSAEERKSKHSAAVAAAEKAPAARGIEVRVAADAA